MSSKRKIRLWKSGQILDVKCHKKIDLSIHRVDIHIHQYQVKGFVSLHHWFKKLKILEMPKLVVYKKVYWWKRNSKMLWTNQTKQRQKWIKKEISCPWIIYGHLLILKISIIPVLQNKVHNWNHSIIACLYNLMLI